VAADAGDRRAVVLSADSPAAARTGPAQPEAEGVEEKRPGRHNRRHHRDDRQRLTIKVDDNTRLRMLRTSIQTVLTDDKKDEDESAKKEAKS